MQNFLMYVTTTKNFNGDDFVETAKIFEHKGVQSVALPKSCEFKKDEVFVNRIGDVVILMPDRIAGTIASLELFTEDFMEDGRPEEITTVREEL